MFGYGNRFVRQSEEIRRIQSVPVIKSQRTDFEKRTKSADYAVDDLLGRSISQSHKRLLGDYIPENKASTLIPVLLTLLACQGALLFGIHIAYSSPTEKSIQQQVNLSQEQSDQMFSLLSIGALVGCLVAAPLSDFIGRRMALVLAGIPYVLGVCLMAIFQTYASLSIGRTFCGFGVGLTSVLVPLYIAETAPTHLRGALGSTNQFFVAGGAVLINAIGFPIIDHPGWWAWMLWLSLIPVAIMSIGMATVGVETPHWLLHKGKDEEAEKAMRYIRGPDYNVSAELNEIIQGMSSEERSKGDGMTDAHEGVIDRIGYLFTVGLRPFMIGIALLFFQQWCGINAIMFHTTELFVTSDNESDSERTRALIGAVAVNGVQFAMCAVTIVLMGYLGRRSLLLISHAGMAVSGALVGVAYANNWAQITVIVFVMFYLGFFSLGVGPLPWLVNSEIFPSYCREIAMSFATFVSWASVYGVTSSQTPMESLLSASGVFWFYSAVGVVAMMVIFVFLPETKGFSLEEIERMFLMQYRDRGYDKIIP